MKTLSIVVTTPPYSPLTITAINYIKSAIALGVSINGVFFYQDGVINASEHHTIPNDEYQVLTEWKALNKNYNIPLHVCVSASEKRGLSDEITINDQQTTNINECFTVSGLGELVELSTSSKRVVQF